MQLHTVTLNPAIDLTVQLSSLEPGAVHRARGEQIEAGGKGIGVAAVAAALERAVSAAGWLGAENDAVFSSAFARLGIADAMQRLPGRTRTNIKLAVADRGDSTDINLPGFALGATLLERALDELLADLQARVRCGDWCELAGSLPPGLDVGAWERLARALSAQGAHIAVDTGGAVLGELLQRLADPARGEPVTVAFIKPNRAELEELLGRALPSVSEVADAAQALCRRHGVQQLIVSLGGEGAVMATAQGRWHAPAPAVPVATTVGAGDALVAGTLHALMDGQPLPQAGCWGMACAAARIQQVALGLPPQADVSALASGIQARPI